MKLSIDLNRYDACPPYNDWLDELHVEQSGELDILGFKPRPSLILFSHSQDTYQALFGDFQQSRQDDLRQSVYSDFPSPIAYYFYRFENGYENNLQRLHFLRDTWESIVDVLHAVAVAECRFRRMTLADPLKVGNLLSDSVAQRIQNIELILLHASNAGLSLGLSRIVTPTVLQTMRELNQTRNAFSHSAAQSEAQANTWIIECLEDVIDVLDDLSGLADLQVLKYGGQKDGNTLRCEVFRGHGGTRTLKDIPLTQDQVNDSRQYFVVDHMLAMCDGSIFSLRPFVHFRLDPSGHATKLCLFRKARGDAPNRRLEYEITGEATRQDQDRNAFKPELDEIRSLFGLGPD
jgi:hypothetical protein